MRTEHIWCYFCWRFYAFIGYNDKDGQEMLVHRAQGCTTEGIYKQLGKYQIAPRSEDISNDGTWSEKEKKKEPRP